LKKIASAIIAALALSAPALAQQAGHWGIAPNGGYVYQQGNGQYGLTPNGQMYYQEPGQAPQYPVQGYGVPLPYQRPNYGNQRQQSNNQIFNELLNER
jgi:hypothetical protein